MYLNITELNSLKDRLNEIYENLKTNLPSIYREISSINSNLVSSSLTEVNSKLLEKIGYSAYVVNSHLRTLVDFVGRQIKEYEKLNNEVIEKLSSLVNHISEVFDNNGNISKYIKSAGPENNVYTVLSDTNSGDDTYNTTSQVKESLDPQASNEETYSTLNAKSPSAAVDINVYSNKPELGFVVTTNDKAYSLNESDVELLTAIVAAESDKSYDDSLAVASVILNRCENDAWIRSYGTNPISQATAPNQFVVYQHGSYKKYMSGNAPAEVVTAVNDALKGVRNNGYLSFRSNSNAGYSNNMITSTGNRYK